MKSIALAQRFLARRFPGIVPETLAVLLASIVLAMLGNALSPRGISVLGGQWDPARGIMHADGHCAPRIQEMDLTSLLFLMEQKQDTLVVVDARSKEEFISGHIPGAVSLPLMDAAFDLPSFLAHHDAARICVVYCSGAECSDAQDLADILREAGGFKVFVYGMGFSGWVAGQRPVENGRL
ncbi:MAG: rhodanese-like domain-containing protein [Fibrobacterota bacterium]